MSLTTMDALGNGSIPSLVEIDINLRMPWEVFFLSFTLLIIIMTGILGNLAVICAVYITPTLREQNNFIFLINLSITDLCNSVFVMTTSLAMAASNGRHVPLQWCRFNCMANYELIIVSMLTLAGISIDRYWAIMYPFRYITIMTKPRVLAMVVYPWFQGLAFGMAPVIMDWVQYDYYEVVCAISWQREKQQAVYYVVIAFVVCFLVPGFVMLFAYISIMQEIKRSNVAGAPANIAKSTSRTLRSLLIVVLCFFVFMTPFCVTKLLKVVMEDSAVPGYANVLSTLCQYLSSVVNPFIYGIFRRDFRNAFHKVFWSVTCRKCNTEPYPPTSGTITSVGKCENVPGVRASSSPDNEPTDSAQSCQKPQRLANGLYNTAYKEEVGDGPSSPGELRADAASQPTTARTITREGLESTSTSSHGATPIEVDTHPNPPQQSDAGQTPCNHHIHHTAAGTGSQVTSLSNGCSPSPQSQVTRLSAVCNPGTESQITSLSGRCSPSNSDPMPEPE